MNLASFISPKALAASITINPNLPGINTTSSPAGFVANFYSFALLLSGILAFGVIVWGGVKYATGRGNPSSESEAKSWITGALLGLLLLAGAYIVLQTVNPDIVSLKLPALPGLNAVSTGGATGGGAAGGGPLVGQCPMVALTPITDPQAQAMENGQTVLWNSSDPNVQKNLDAVAAAYAKLQSVLSQPSIGDSVSVSSVYRPLAYQAHLYDIYQRAMDYQLHPNYTSYPDCNTVISQLQAEEQKHGICYGSHPCLVAAPSSCSPHVRGVAIDLIISGPFGYSALNPILSSNNVGLVWKALPNDNPHFELANPPYTGCASS